MSKTLFCGNLSFRATEQDIEDWFSSYEVPVEKVKIPADKETGRPRGFAFVEVADQHFDAALNLHGHDLQGRAININEARPMEPRSGGGGGRRDRGERRDRY